MRLNGELTLIAVFTVFAASIVDVSSSYAGQQGSLTKKDANKKIAILLNERKYTQSILMIRDQLKHNDTWAELNMALLYKAGLGVQRSDKKAFHWYAVAANNGNHYAARYVANAYLEGDGVYRNPKQAAHWFRVGLAPNQWAGAFCGVANTYAHGFLVHNPEKAFIYHKKCVATMAFLEPNKKSSTKAIKYAEQYW